MKNIIVMFIAGLLTAVISGCFSHWPSFNGNAEKKTENADDVLGKIHHPLIDIPFMSATNENSDWLIINHSNLFTDDERFEIIQGRGAFLHFDTEHLKVITFPRGRGTTPNGVIYVFRNGILIRDVPYWEIYITSTFLTNEFRQVTRVEIEEIINSKLPPAI
ncbi:MAG: hypothetical protein LBC70_08735 [Chitinispirillales bacterium]|nr:hypothetical protein [Chitinispirillales bacterium]